MPLETGDRIGDLNPLWPLGTDPKSQGDDHIRLVKNVLVETLGDLADETIAEWLAPQLAEKLDLTGGTMTGALTLRTDDDTTAFGDDEAVPKRYVDGFQIGVEEFHDPAAVGSWRIIGMTLECWGLSPAGGSPVRTVTFPKTFARPPEIFGTAVTTASQLTSMNVRSRTVTGFEFESIQNFGGNNDHSWYAVGEVAPDPPPP